MILKRFRNKPSFFMIAPANNRFIQSFGLDDKIERETLLQ